MKPWQAAAALFVAAGAVLGGAAWWRARVSVAPRELLGALPGDAAAIVVYADLKALRAAGILDRIAGSAAGQDPEYQEFVQATGFDYRRDLDAAAAALGESANYVVLRGRFDFARLARYARRQGGSCAGDRCELAASDGRRRITFRQFGGGLALAVAEEAGALDRIAPGTRNAGVTPAGPLWVAAPGAAFRRWPDAPLAAVFARAERSEFALAARDGQLDLRFAMACADTAAAQALAAELTAATALLKRRAPPAAELAGMLAEGTYAARDRVVEGRWPAPPALLENLLGAVP
jgi:hypothetical protein